LWSENQLAAYHVLHLANCGWYLDLPPNVILEDEKLLHSHIKEQISRSDVPQVASARSLTTIASLKEAATIAEKVAKKDEGKKTGKNGRWPKPPKSLKIRKERNQKDI
jgi:hypothetical protein